MCMHICINLWELPGLQWSHPWLLFLVLNLLVLNLPSLDSLHIFTQMTKRCQGGLQPPLEVTFPKKTKKEKIIFRWKKNLFKITGIIPWGQSKLVMTMNGVLGCFYGVLETLFFSERQICWLPLDWDYIGARPSLKKYYQAWKLGRLDTWRPVRLH